MVQLLMACRIIAIVLVSEITTADKSRDDRDVQERAISLSQIVTTSPQQGMLHRKDVFPRKDGTRDPVVNDYQFQQIERAATSGASNVFLVDAPDIYGATNATSSIVLGSRAARTPAPVNAPKAKTGNYWFVAYLGAGPSSPTWWTVESVVVSASKIRMTYRESPPSPATLRWTGFTGPLEGWFSR
jgi:hypothetical protein